MADQRYISGVDRPVAAPGGFGIVLAVVTAMILLSFLPGLTMAAGTAAGTLIPNTATMTFAVDGAHKNTRSNTTLTLVDEVLDVVVAPEQAEPVAIDSPMDSAVLSFLVSNTGNGSEAYHLFLDLNINEGGFDPAAGQLFIESNGVPGLQTGPGGDQPHVDGTAVVIAAGALLSVYAVAEIPGALATHAESRIRLRAVSGTLIAAAGIDDPDSPDFPQPGSNFAGLGDGGTHAVVGLTHQSAQPVFFAFSGFRVDAPVVTLNKTAVAVRAPDGSDAVRPGSLVDYRLQVEVRGAGGIGAASLTDVLPAELDFVAGSLAINGVPEDDDLEPAATDIGGFDGGLRTVKISLGDIALAGPAGAAVHIVTFSATIR